MRRRFYYLNYNNNKSSAVRRQEHIRLKAAWQRLFCFTDNEPRSARHFSGTPISVAAAWYTPSPHNALASPSTPRARNHVPGYVWQMAMPLSKCANASVGLCRINAIYPKARKGPDNSKSSFLLSQISWHFRPKCFFIIGLCYISNIVDLRNAVLK